MTSNTPLTCAICGVYPCVCPADRRAAIKAQAISNTTECRFADLHLPERDDCEMCATARKEPLPTQAAELQRDFARERWFGEIQIFLERMAEAAPDETCRTFGRNLWDQTAEFTDDD